MSHATPIIALALLLVICLPCQTYAAAPGGGNNDVDDTDLALSGGGLSADEAAAIERSLVDNPDNRAARLKLLGYYFRKQDRAIAAARRPHVLWLVTNDPECDFAGSPYAAIRPIIDFKGLGELRRVWDGHLAKQPENTAILGNYARLLLLVDPKAAQALYERAHAVEPTNPEWPDRMAHLADLRGGPDDPAVALRQAEAALALTTKPADRFHRLTGLIRYAADAGDWAKTRRYGDEALAMAPDFRGNWNYGNAVHKAHTGLGLAALNAGDLEAAKRHLLDAGRNPGSPQLDSFGPSMTLARALLDRGERDVVLEYLTLVKAFWRQDATLDGWATEIRAGNMPDFGRRLRY